MTDTATPVTEGEFGRCHSRRQLLMARARWAATQCGLDDEERRELAMMLPTQSGASGPVSWALLSDQELALMIAWLRGAMLVEDLRRLR
jgi:hypothetical protein